MIGQYLPKDIQTFYEPFCGSGAMTIYAAYHRLADRFVLGDTLEPIVSLLREIVENPDVTANRYRELWNGQKEGDLEYFNRVRERYNSDRDPVELLYLICRCAKNAIQFNDKGNFTQSVDKRRLGMRPEKMDAQISGMSRLLAGRVEFRAGDWVETVDRATPSEFVYMDPPYLGTSIGRDKRYHKQLFVAYPGYRITWGYLIVRPVMSVLVLLGILFCLERGSRGQNERAHLFLVLALVAPVLTNGLFESTQRFRYNYHIDTFYYGLAAVGLLQGWRVVLDIFRMAATDAKAVAVQRWWQPVFIVGFSAAVLFTDLRLTAS